MPMLRFYSRWIPIGCLSLMWTSMGLISVNHFFGNLFIPAISTRTMGLLAWLTIGSTAIFLSRNFWKQAAVIFLLFFFIGYVKGPYLEPPADPLYHAQRTHFFCGKKSDQIEKKNKGLWHYSMSSVFLCSAQKTKDPEKILNRFDIVHGCFVGISMVVLFILAKSATLTGRWAFMSILIAFLFFGTNRFGFFSHYSLAPTCSSLLIYWLWIAVFFFGKTEKYIWPGLAMAAIGLPILIVNHLQEAFFLLFITSIWLFFYFHQIIWRRLEDRKQRKILYGGCLFLLFFVLPQFDFFQKIISSGFERNRWYRDSDLVVFFQGIHLFGKIWSYRISDTLGIMGFLPVGLSVLMFIKKTDKTTDARRRVALLGLLPFIGYLIPLYNYAWLANAGTNIYYRLSYCSMFWLTISYFLSDLEEKMGAIRCSIGRHAGKAHFYLLWIALIIFFGQIRSTPFFGKLDFILLDSRPWWVQWQPVVETAMMQKGKIVISDPQTSAVLNGVFNVNTEKTANRKDRDFNFKRGSKIWIRTNTLRDGKYKYIVNFRGFTPSWVPDETWHWNKKVAETYRYYRFRKQTGKKLVNLFKTNPPKGCEIFY